jgi:hypothetical protein
VAVGQNDCLHFGPMQKQSLFCVIKPKMNHLKKVLINLLHPSKHREKNLTIFMAK